jgi:hypothetical protein
MNFVIASEAKQSRFNKFKHLEIASSQKTLLAMTRNGFFNSLLSPINHQTHLRRNNAEQYPFPLDEFHLA